MKNKMESKILNEIRKIKLEQYSLENFKKFEDLFFENNIFYHKIKLIDIGSYVFYIFLKDRVIRTSINNDYIGPWRNKFKENLRSWIWGSYNNKFFKNNYYYAYQMYRCFYEE